MLDPFWSPPKTTFFDAGQYNVYCSDVSPIWGFQATNGSSGMRFAIVGSSTQAYRFYTDELTTLAFTINTNGILGCLVTNWASAATQDVGVSATTGAANFVKFTSSRRYKNSIQPIGFDMDKLHKLEAKQFKWNSNGKLDFGFIAEEVAAIMPELVNYQCDDNGPILDENGQLIPESVKYKQMTALLMEEVKKLALRIKKLEKNQPTT